VAGACSATAPSRCTWTCTWSPAPRFEQPLPAGHNAFVYVYRGALDIGAQPVPVQRMAILANARRRRRAPGGRRRGRARDPDRRPAAGEPIASTGPS
jgi:redox-sensitive bicupin YhaK (pirin superfamily)